jgi:hypothetical protein
MSTTESEYLSLSTALRNAIPLMRLVNELKYNLDIPMDIITKVHCTLFEDNSGAVEMVKLPKMRPRTKDINTKYHHLCKYVFEGKIKVVQVPTTEQVADIFTKNLPQDLFLYFRQQILGW